MHNPLFTLLLGKKCLITLKKKIYSPSDTNEVLVFYCVVKRNTSVWLDYGRLLYNDCPDFILSYYTLGSQNLLGQFWEQ
ncbi:MAG TPA: hypothetical protein PLW93_06300 [Candidatus Absconditabacterales bacterium]|nr:hypothetical protein [Candidatus Absconditabacterales bacterium]